MTCRRWLALALILCVPALVRAEVFLSDEQALAQAFDKGCKLEKKLVLPTRDQRAELEREVGAERIPKVFRCWVAVCEGRVAGYAVIDDVLGKSEPITYMLTTDAELRVRAVEILAYRESHGGEVRQDKWRAQFVGKDRNSKLRVGSDIRNIAGATISCRSLTDGVRIQLALLEKLAPRLAPALETNPHSASASGADQPGTEVVRERLLMGTTLRVRIAEHDAAAARAAADAAFAEVARLEDILSTWRPASATSLLNARSGAPPSAVPPELFELLATSRRFSDASAGSFDVTVGPLIALWRQAAESAALPPEHELERARAKVGWRAIVLEPAGLRVGLAAGASVDFGAIGKGYALDRARDVLVRHGVQRALLDFGGQILALDPPDGAAGWRVELRDPSRPDQTACTLWLRQASLSTTADYERGMVIGAERRSHVVDPRTGKPASTMLAASVVAASATEADAWSTAMFVMELEQALAFAKARGLAVALTDLRGERHANPEFSRLEERAH
jgi:FAD:protein FMN transferase